MKTRLFPLLLAVLFLLTACTGTQNEETPNTKPTLSKTYYKALEQSRLLQATFARDETGEFIYPEEFAGTFIGDDDRLHILIVNAEPGCYNHIVKARYVRYASATYSYNTLRATQDNLWEEVTQMMDEGRTPPLNGIGVDTENNCLDISVPSESMIEPLVSYLKEKGIPEDMYQIEVAIFEDAVEPTQIWETVPEYSPNTTIQATPDGSPSQVYVQAQYGSLLDSFGDTYPDEYAGAYLDDDGLLCILITTSEHGIYNDRIDAQIVRYLTVSYSLNELAALRNLLSEHHKDLHLAAISIDQSENAVSILVSTQVYADACQAFLDRQEIPSDMYTISFGSITPA